MTDRNSRYHQVKSLLREPDQSRYAAFRESLRIIVPYELRRRAVNLLRSRFGIKTFRDWAQWLVRAKNMPPAKRSFRRGDFYESVTLLPHLPEAEVKAILEQPIATSPVAKPDVICFSIVDWSFRFQRPQQLMAQFAAHGHRVFYLSISQFRSPYAQPKFTARQIRENLYEVQIASDRPMEISHAAVEGHALDLALESLDELRRAYHISEAIGYVMIPSWGRVASQTQQRWGWPIVYDCMDEWENFPGIKAPLLELEKSLVESCDLLVVTAQRLYEKWLPYQRRMALARNAADYDFYQKRCKPNDLLEGVNHPIVGYYGAIADWFDVDLLVEVAQSRPQYTFVLLGGVFDVDVSRLRDLPNVRMPGQQPYETMPQYLYHFDACIIPFKINSITEATDPVKLYEYLSGGKPVVSVKLPEVAPYRDCVYLAGNAPDFAEKLDQAVSESDPSLAKRRKSLAKRNDWKARYFQIESALTETYRRASIIIVTYNNLPLTRLCLESVARNTGYPNYEVIVVDNNSTDGTQNYLKNLAEKRKDLKLILNEINNGFAKANNQGIQQSSGDYLVLLNNDTIVPQGWLSKLLRHLDDPEVGLVGPVTNFVGNEAKIDVAYRAWAEMEAFAQDYTWAKQDQAADIYLLAMFCVALRREVFNLIGPLDERFGVGMFEDDDYSMRVRQAGYRIICAADAFVHHFGQAAFGKLIRSGDYDRIFDENRRKFEEKWGVKWKPHQHARLEFKPHRRRGAASE
ncbi:MAG: glycosyltransferase [Acidobacteria bacterium]|nr:glycosyltransferase [Acidobacteriota bacterium]